MLTIRTDLAAEAHALWQESAGETTALPGVRAREQTFALCKRHVPCKGSVKQH